MFYFAAASAVTVSFLLSPLPLVTFRVLRILVNFIFLHIPATHVTFRDGLCAM